MNLGLISTRYATALIAFSSESEMSHYVYEEAKVINKAFLKFKELRSVLNNPVLAVSEKKKIIVSVAGGSLSKPLDAFIDLLLRNKRESKLQNILLKSMDMYRLQNNIHAGKLTTASEIDTLTEKRLIEMVQKEVGGTVEIEKHIDVSILGGFMLEVDFKRWDASLLSQLTTIRKEYIEVNKNHCKF